MKIKHWSEILALATSIAKARMGNNITAGVLVTFAEDEDGQGVASAVGTDQVVWGITSWGYPEEHEVDEAVLPTVAGRIGPEVEVSANGDTWTLLRDPHRYTLPVGDAEDFPLPTPQFSYGAIKGKLGPALGAVAGMASDNPAHGPACGVLINPDGAHRGAVATNGRVAAWAACQTPVGGLTVVPQAWARVVGGALVRLELELGEAEDEQVEGVQWIGARGWPTGEVEDNGYVIQHEVFAKLLDGDFPGSWEQVLWPKGKKPKGPPVVCTTARLMECLEAVALIAEKPVVGVTVKEGGMIRLSLDEGGNKGASRLQGSGGADISGCYRAGDLELALEGAKTYGCKEIDLYLCKDGNARIYGQGYAACVKGVTKNRG